MAKKTSKSSKAKSGWGWVESNQPGKPTDAEKAKVTALFEPYVQELNEGLPPLEEPQQFNQAVRVEAKWRGSYFYLMSHYKCPPKPEYDVEGFEVGVARLTYKSPGVYDLSYFRHTGQWATIFYELSLEDCLEQIESAPHFEV
ncbi:MAG: hypothetical protein H6573_02360 [Lewinellaceae bacterium]|nr:hypothetical protein [Phaeodactylibacter sp.]MCB9346339.1 hypothetical protein [Lewinellaceae bacterium]